MVERAANPGTAGFDERRLTIVLHEADRLGAGLAIVRAIPHLQKLGWCVSLFLPEDGPLLDAVPPVDDLVIAGFRPVAVSRRGWTRPPGFRARVRSSRGYLSSLRRDLARQEPDVVHVNSLHALPEAFVARRAGLPVVLHVHESPPPSLKRALSVWTACRIATGVVAVSDAVAKMYPPNGTPVTTVYNGVARRAPSPVRSLQTVGSIGHICEPKGTDVLLEAARIVQRRRPGVEFEHVGPAGLDGDQAFQQRVESLAREAPSVRLLGAGDVDEALGRWGAVVQPSRRDSFSLATLEAMSAGVPVIASDVGGMPEQIIDGKTGILIPPNDPAQLADAVLRLIEDGSLRERLGTAARERVTSLFTYEHQAQGLHAAYRRALT